MEYRLELENIRVFREFGVQGRNIVLTGRNGSGKSSILLSMSAVFSLLPDGFGKAFIRRGETKGTIRLFNDSGILSEINIVKKRNTYSIQESGSVQPKLPFDLVYISPSSNSARFLYSSVADGSDLTKRVSDFLRKLNLAHKTLSKVYNIAKSIDDEDYLKLFEKYNLTMGKSTSKEVVKTQEYSKILEEFNNVNEVLVSLESALDSAIRMINLAKSGKCPTCGRPVDRSSVDLKELYKEVSRLKKAKREFLGRKNELQKEIIAANVIKGLPSLEELEDTIRFVIENPLPTVKKISTLLPSIYNEYLQDIIDELNSILSDIGVTIRMRNKTLLFNDMPFELLSSGEKSVVNIASSVVSRKVLGVNYLIVIDEALDFISKDRVKKIGDLLLNSGCQVWAASHRVDIIAYLSDHGFDVYNLEEV